MGKKIAIYGAGTIGACQATLTSGNGYSTVVIGHSEEGLSRCRNTMLQNWNDLIAQKLATAANRRAAMVLAPGEISHFGPGGNRQFWPDENRQS